MHLRVKNIFTKIFWVFLGVGGRTGADIRTIMLGARRFLFLFFFNSRNHLEILRA